MNKDRLEISRLFHRFGFGPRPGEFQLALNQGVIKTRENLTNVPTSDIGILSVATPTFLDLGARPKPNTPEIIKFAMAMRQQTDDLLYWWLDRMALCDHGLTERMTWFWHGHWATSLAKVDYPLAMYKQNQTLRENALGNFKTMTRSMVIDGALQFWLDGQESTLKSPNENLARELMELFTIGVGRYSESDVKALARVLTGFQVKRSTGITTFNPKRHDLSQVEILGQLNTFTAESAADLLVNQNNCARFIAERMWFRFISSTETMPENFSVISAFSDRNILTAAKAITSDSAMQDPQFAMVKSPLDWFISVCRALELTPSKLENVSSVKSHLNKLGQLPFYPPNVGGWPAGSAWLSSASTLHRIEFTKYLVKQSTLNVLRNLPVKQRVAASADWLGIAEWSPRTQSALRNSISNPQEFAILALCSPEYVVNA